MPKSKQTLMEQCRRLPGQVRLACEQAARNRYSRHYHPSNPFRRHHMIVDGIMAGLIAALLLTTGFIAFIYQRAVQHQQVEVRVQAAKSVISGDTVRVHIDVVNNGRQALRQATVRVPTGAGFIPVGATEFTLNTIGGHETVGVDINGQVIADTESALHISAVFSYVTSLGDTQEEIGSVSLPVTQSHIKVQLELPESLAVGKTFPFAVTISNDAATAFDNVIVEPNLPPDWETVQESLASDPATQAWTIDRIGSLETVRITGEARLRAAASDFITLAVKAYAAPLGVPYLQAQSEVTVPTFASNVSARLLTVPAYLSLGQNAELTVEIANREAFPLTQARLDLHANDQLIDPAQWTDATYTDGVFAVPFEDIAAKQTMRTILTIPLRPTVNPALAFGQDGAGFAWVAEFHFMHDGQLVTIPFEARRLPLRTDLSLTATLRHSNTEGEQIAIGPWPPRAGEQTTVWLFLQPNNRLNALDRVVVTGHLGLNVRVADRQSVTSGSAIRFDANGNFTWVVGTVGDYRATAETVPSAALELEMLPSADETEQASIVDRLIITGFDTSAKSQVSATAPDLAVEDVLAR